MRILTWIIAIAVVVVGGFLAWGNSSKQDLAEDNTQQDADTEAWVDYKNDVYGVSLQYPLEWEAIEALKPQELRALHEGDLAPVGRDDGIHGRALGTLHGRGHEISPAA